MRNFVRFVLPLALFLFFIPAAFGKVLILTNDANFQEMVQQNPDLVSQCGESLSGDTCLQVTSKKFYNKNIEGWNFPIVQNPVAENEYRYILFAWKQKGGKSLMLQLANNSGWGSALSYTAGNPGNTLLKINLSAQSPSDWNVVVRDVYKDMIISQFDRNFNHNFSLKDIVITGIALTPWDGEYGQWDKIFLGTDEDELLQIADKMKENVDDKAVDPLDVKKEDWDGYIYDTYEWEKVAQGFAKIESKLSADKKRFLARDVALANAWLSLDSFAKGNNGKARTYYNKARKYLKVLGLPANTWGLDYLKALFSQKKAPRSVAPQYVQKIALVAVPSDFNSGEFRKFLLEWNIVKTFIEQNSGGKLSLKTEFVSDDKSARDFDVIVYYHPTLGVSNGGMGTVLSAKKGVISLSRGHPNPDDFILPLHELVHVYEHFFNLKTEHIFRTYQDYAKKPLQAELRYYEDFFRNMIGNAVGGNWSVLSWH